MAIHKLTGKAYSGTRWHRVRRCLSKCKNAKTVVLPFRSNGNYAVQGSSRQLNKGQFGGQSIYLSAWHICDPCCFSIVQSQLSTEPSTAFHIWWWSFLEAEASLHHDNYGVNSQTIQLITSKRWSWAPGPLALPLWHWKGHYCWEYDKHSILFIALLALPWLPNI